MFRLNVDAIRCLTVFAVIFGITLIVLHSLQIHHYPVDFSKDCSVAPTDLSEPPTTVKDLYCKFIAGDHFQNVIGASSKEIANHFRQFYIKRLVLDVLLILCGFVMCFLNGLAAVFVSRFPQNMHQNKNCEGKF